MDSLTALPAGGRIVKRRVPFAMGMFMDEVSPDASYERKQVDSSNGSGDIYYVSKNKGSDGHPDVNRYERSVNYTPAGQDYSLSILGGASSANPTSNTYHENITYKKAGRVAGSSAIGDRQPEKAKRAKYVGSDKPSSGGTSNKKIGRNQSTILTGAKGALGSSQRAKTILGG